MKDLDEVLEVCFGGVDDWFGGIWIVFVFYDFNWYWFWWVLFGKLMVFLIMDGLEWDFDEDLEREMDWLYWFCC